MRDDARHDDQRHAVADAPAGDLLAQPHQEHRAADQRDHRRHAEHHAWLDHRLHALVGAQRLQPDGDEIALDRGQQHGAITRILVELLASALAFLLDRGELRRQRGGELHDDRRRDVRHHAERDQRHARQRAAREGVEEIEHAALGLLTQQPQRGRVDAGERHIAQHAEHDQRADREPQPLLEVCRLREFREADALRHLVGCGCHRASVPSETKTAEKALNAPPRRSYSHARRLV